MAAYFDHNATTALDPRVLETMLPFLRGQQGNPGSRHSLGRIARDAVEQARAQVAQATGAHAAHIVFTSGGTEADNLALQGIAAAQTPSQIILSAIEHPAVSKAAQLMQWRGWKLAQIRPHAEGTLDLDALEQALQHKTALVSVMLANNETGVVQDVAAACRLAHRHGALLHTDAVQALGKIPLDFEALGVDAMSLSSHKIGGPQGAGVLVLDKRVDVRPLHAGGGQEKGLRSGSENLAAIVGFGCACELAQHELAQRAAATARLRDRLERSLASLDVAIFGKDAPRLPNTSFFALPGIEGETLVMALDRRGFAVASGSACSSNSTEPSPVLLAMGVSPDLARGAVRVSLGTGNTAEEVDALLETLAQEAAQLHHRTAIAV